MNQYIPKQDKNAEEERKAREEAFKQEKERKKRRKTITIAIALIAVMLTIGGIVYSSVSPGRYDSFAKCLTEKGAVMYGEDWCKYTNAQKAMFGKSFRHINYQVKENLEKRPTWVIDDKSYETVQSFERLAALTGCKI